MADRSLTGFRLVGVQQGDTLQGIAARELGDASRWSDLITINGLVWPYLTGDPDVAGPGVLLYGALIRVPAAQATVAADVDPAAVFGTSFRLTNGLLTAEGGTIALVSGRENLRQALSGRVVTDQGELIRHPNYGCRARRLLGKVAGPTAALLGAQYVKAAVLDDPRVASVPSSTAELAGDRLSLSATVQPIAGSAVDISTD